MQTDSTHVRAAQQLLPILGEMSAREAEFTFMFLAGLAEMRAEQDEPGPDEDYLAFAPPASASDWDAWLENRREGDPGESYETLRAHAMAEFGAYGVASFARFYRGPAEDNTDDDPN